MSAFSYPVRPEVRAFDPYVAGLSIEAIRERFGLDSIIKMASNENPLGVSPLVREALVRNADRVFLYARPGNPRLIAALAAHHNLPCEHFVAGNGSDEVIDLLMRACPSPGVHNVVAARPCFSMYKISARLCGTEFRQVPLLPDFSFDWEGLLAAVDENTALVFLTMPDNPSGHCAPASLVRAFAAALPPTCLLVLDEAYMDFADNEAEASLLPSFNEFSNLVFLRTFSKSFGLAGLRLGYGVMPVNLAERLQSIHPPFSVNILAEEAGLAALEDTAFRQKTLIAVRRGREELTRGLEALGCRVLPSQANFLMFSLPESSGQSAAGVFEALLARGIIIRPLNSYDLPDYLRVSVGARDENKLFLEAMAEVL